MNEQIEVEEVTVEELARELIWSRSEYSHLYTTWRGNRPPEVEYIKLEVRQGPERSGGVDGWVYTGKVKSCGSSPGSTHLNDWRSLYDKRVHAEPGSPKITAMVEDLLTWLAEHVNKIRYERARDARKKEKLQQEFLTTMSAIQTATESGFAGKED